MQQALAITVVALCLVSGGLFFPFGRDQGNYAYPAWAWLDGQMPYRDVYVFKPPATVWVHALAQLLFGHSMVAVRILDLGWTVATALCIVTLHHGDRAALDALRGGSGAVGDALRVPVREL